MGLSVKWLVVLCLGAGVGAVSAKAKSPCADDARKFCQDVAPGGERIGKCLRAHLDELSPGCKELQARRLASMAKVGNEPCHDDVQKFCGKVKGGSGRLVACLKSHRDELSATCKSKIKD